MTASPAPPRFRSSFGGLWTDLSNARAVVAGRLELGLLDEPEAARLLHWIDRGFVILKGAVEGPAIDAVLEDLQGTLDGRLPPCKAEWWAPEGKQFGDATAAVMDRDGSKLLDLHAASRRCQEMIFAEPISRFLALVFERPALAFQSLTFVRPTRQPVHRDTAFVPVTSPLEMVACWIALQDVEEGSGELEYYPGSHAMEEELFDGGSKSVPDGVQLRTDYSDGLHEKARAAGLTLERFVPSRGDALIWAADLIHGGRGEVRPGSTRRSHVTHYCPIDQQPLYLSRIPDPRPRPSVRGGYVCHQPL